MTITLIELTDAVWDRATTAMAEQAHFSAALLAGQMPESIDAAFQLETLRQPRCSELLAVAVEPRNPA